MKFEALTVSMSLPVGVVKQLRALCKTDSSCHCLETINNNKKPPCCINALSKLQFLSS